MTSSEWAAWAQAYGSIGAIFAAWWLTRWQIQMKARQDFKKSSAALYDQLELIFEVSGEIHKIASTLHANIKLSAHAEIAHELVGLRIILDVFQKIDLSTYPLILVAVDATRMEYAAEQYMQMAELHANTLNAGNDEEVSDATAASEAAINALNLRYKAFQGSLWKFSSKLWE
jgi:hypothetical protein